MAGPHNPRDEQEQPAPNPGRMLQQTGAEERKIIVSNRVVWNRSSKLRGQDQPQEDPGYPKQKLQEQRMFLGT